MFDEEIWVAKLIGSNIQNFHALNFPSNFVGWDKIGSTKLLLHCHPENNSENSKISVNFGCVIAEWMMNERRMEENLKFFRINNNNEGWKMFSLINFSGFQCLLDEKKIENSMKKKRQRNLWKLFEKVDGKNLSVSR